MTYLSIIVIKGATKVAAASPEQASAANLNPKFFVFQFLASATGSATFGARVGVVEDASRFIVVVGGSTPGV